MGDHSDMRINDAADVLRKAGLKVNEQPGWKTRSNGNTFSSIRGLTVHHTAGSKTSTVVGELKVLINGRPGLSGPISQFMVARDGTWYCVASGCANHNKIGTAGPNKGYGNSQLIGVECQHAGASEEWTPTQYNSVVKGVAALAKHYGFTVATIAGHKEHQPGEKVDPSFSMNAFRDKVRDAMTSKPTPGKVHKMLALTGLSLPELRQGMDDADYDGYNHVWRLQKMLRIEADGDYGPATAAAVKEYMGSGDGKVVGLKEWTKLYGLSQAK